MPRRFKKGKKRSSRNRRRMRASRNPSVRNYQRVQTMRTIVPDRLRTKLDMTAFISYTFSSNHFGKNYVANDMHQPGNGDFATQPAGFIPWMNFYQKYVVYASTIQLQFINASEDSAISGIWVAVYPSRDPNTLNSGTYIDASSQPYVKRTFVGSPVAMNICKVSNSMATSKIWGFNAFTDIDFSAEVDSPPTNTWFWAIAMSGIDNNPSFPVVTGAVKIKFHVEFFDRKPIAETDDS